MKINRMQQAEEMVLRADVVAPTLAFD